jgi:hypothetical protein
VWVIATFLRNKKRRQSLPTKQPNTFVLDIRTTADF